MNAIRMTETHLASVAEIERLCFSEPWSEDALRLLLTDAAVGFVCEENGCALAYAGMLLTPFEGQVTNVAVHPQSRRRGLGRALTEAMIAEAEKRGLEQISLEVRVSNEPAIALYRSFGFYEAGKRTRFYRNPTEDAWVMLCDLTEKQKERKPI